METVYCRWAQVVYPVSLLLWVILTWTCTTPTPAEQPHAFALLQEVDLSSDALGDDLGLKEPLPAHVIEALASMTSLTSVDLSRRPVTERQLHELARRLSRLQQLSIHGCPVSPDQVARLEKAYPHINIHKRNLTLENPPELAVALGGLSLL